MLSLALDRAIERGVIDPEKLASIEIEVIEERLKGRLELLRSKSEARERESQPAPKPR